MLLLLVVALLLGAITTGIGRAIIEVYIQVSARSFGNLFELLTGVIFSLINVMAVAGSATVAGARIGLYSGAATAVMVLLLALLNTRITLPLRLVAFVALAMAGGSGALYGATNTGSAATLGALLAYTAGGLSFGFLTAQSIVPRQVHANADQAQRRHKKQ
jgi:hypothetical protein